MHPINKPITLIIGPTAAGKSAYAIELARHTGAHIISADAFQVYLGMDIGTAKVSKAIRQEIPHYLIDIVHPSERYTVADFVTQATQISERLKAQNIPVIICGGTGFYLYAFMNQFQFPADSSDLGHRKKLESELQEHGLQYMWDQLNQIDPAYATKIGSNDQKRILRGLETYYLTEKRPSSFQNQEKPRDDIEILGIQVPKEKLHASINHRVDLMIEQGLIGEVKGLLDQGIGPTSQSFEALGYKETVAYLNGSLKKEEMIELIKQKTRQFAKRQMTWFRRFTHAKWI